jgi:hypothetical protein
MSIATRVTGLSAALVLFPYLAAAQTIVGERDSIYTWRGPLPSGAVLSVRNFNGPVDVRASNGSTAEIRAEKRTSRGGGRIADVAFSARTSSNGDVTFCSTFRDRDPCDSDRRGWNWSDDDRYVTVAMTVLVPRGAQLRVSTGNGPVSVQQVGGEIQATTGNGRVTVAGTDGTVRVTTGNGDVDVRDAKGAVRVTTGNGRVKVATSQGPVNARSGNGDIDVRMNAVRANEDMGFHTGSGSVRVTLPASYNGEIDASTGNGGVRSDFELKIQGRMSPRRVRATIGDGGPMLKLTTGNGQLEIRKAP